MAKPTKSTPNYRAFAKEMMKLCAKYGIKMTAHDEGNVVLGPATAKSARDYPYYAFAFSPTEARLENPTFDAKVIVMTREEEE